MKSRTHRKHGRVSSAVSLPDVPEEGFRSRPPHLALGVGWAVSFFDKVPRYFDHHLRLKPFLLCEWVTVSER